jgi:hypothetical protein
MDMQMELMEVADCSITVTVSSNCGGKSKTTTDTTLDGMPTPFTGTTNSPHSTVFLILTVDSGDHVTRADTMMTEQEVRAMVGMQQFQAETIAPHSYVDVQFTDLKPNQLFVIYAVADSTDAESLPLCDEERVTHLEAKTNAEYLDIEWARLSPAMRLVGVRIKQKTSFYPPLVQNLVFSPSYHTYANWFFF